ncbi:DUF5302 domain-containing protein [Propioniciclava coleopterorum]|uniref:DUF5302 domain-containing protein n=1 Tax=Propioniciclava coleopterorum TaxID=2714937 RepID=A0A6G7Y6W9_9ACTN|nr:DUF5302 domain-containing protein [Propioniciclava coleopterorum]QIK72459.1 DUF5302 domain-containing protein [Propioniciclava coleopterorum]
MSDAAKQADSTPDPKEQMRAALEAKRAAQHGSAAGGENKRKAAGGPHGQQGGKRTFRRKSGG